MKKVMILGASAGQIPFIKICKEFGAYVIAVSPKGNYPGFAYADEAVYLDTRDKDGILKVALQKKIDAILTDQTDVSVPSVAYVAEKMGLKGIGYETALKFTNKYLMRKEAERIGVAVPKFADAKTVQEAREAVKTMEFPVIVKPVDGCGSRGVTKVEKLEDLDLAVSDAIKYSGTKSVIVEEFVVGKEYLVDGIALNNKYINLDLGIKEYFDIKNKYISKMCMFSSAALITNRVEQKVLEANEKMVKGIGLPFGITHAEYMYSERDDKVYLIEIAARGGGVYLSSHLTPKASGIDTNRMIVDYVLNDNICDLEKLVLDKKVSAWRCFELVPGKVERLENVNMTKNIMGVMEVFVDELAIGKEIGELEDDTGKKGPILVYGNSREDCYNTIKEVQNTLKVYTISDGELNGIKW